MTEFARSTYSRLVHSPWTHSLPLTLRESNFYFIIMYRENITTKYRDFHIVYDEENNLWKSTDSLGEDVSCNSLKSLKARLLRKEKKQFEPVEAYHNAPGYGECKFEIVSIYAINDKGRAYFIRPNGKKNNNQFVEKWHWEGNAGKPNFFVVNKYNEIVIKRMTENRKERDRLENEYEKLSNKLIGVVLPKIKKEGE